MDRSAFLGTLPFLHKINPLSSSRQQQQHHKLIRTASTFSEQQQLHHHHRKGKECVDLNFPQGVLFTDHVTSIEPIGYHNGQSIGPAFFSVRNPTPPAGSVAPLSVEPDQVVDGGDGANNKSNDDGDVGDNKQGAGGETSLEEEPSPLPSDPALCTFRAALLSATLPRLSNSSAYGNSEERSTLKQQQNHPSHLTSPASSTASTYMTATPSQTSPPKLTTTTTTRAATNLRNDVRSEVGDPTYVLYFWFGSQVYCVDHGQICSIHIESSSASNNVPSSSDKPPSLVITFDSCSFRIFQLPPPPSSSNTSRTKTATSPIGGGDEIPTKDKQQQQLWHQEKYLEGTFQKLRHFLSTSPITSGGTTNQHEISFDEYLLHLHNRWGGAASSSSVLQSSEESSIRHENGQVTSCGPAVDKLLYPDRTEGSSQGGSEEKEGGEKNANCGTTTKISSSSPIGDKCVKTEIQIGEDEPNVVLGGSAGGCGGGGEEDLKHVQMKRKLDSYQKSWFALQSIHSVMNPTTTCERMRQRYKGGGDTVTSMMMTCAQELGASYYGSLKQNTSTTVDDPMENNQEYEEVLSSRQADEEVLKEKLSCVQKELDDTIRFIFPAPMKSRAKKSRFTAAATTKETSNSVSKYGHCDNGRDVTDLKREIEKCLRNHRETVMKRHSLAFLPVRYADKSANEDT